jgi:hypothetical protein
MPSAASALGSADGDRVKGESPHYSLFLRNRKPRQEYFNYSEKKM